MRWTDIEIDGERRGKKAFYKHNFKLILSANYVCEISLVKHVTL